MYGVRAQLGEIVRLPIQRRKDLADIGRLRPARPIPGQIFRPGATGQRLHQRGFVGRRPQQRPHLHEGLVDREIRRRDANANVVPRQFKLLVHEPGEFVEPRQIGLGVVNGLDPVLGVEEIGNLAIGAAQLAQHIGLARSAAAVIETSVAFVADLGGEQYGVVAYGVGAGQSGAVYAPQFVEPSFRVGGVPGDRRRRTLTQTPLQPRQIALVETKTGGEFGAAL